jgi:hypothetical protein
MRIYYHTGGELGGNSRLWSVAIAGGRPEKVMERVAAAALSPDGKTVAVVAGDSSGIAGLGFSTQSAQGPSRFWRVPLDGGPSEEVQSDRQVWDFAWGGSSTQPARGGCRRMAVCRRTTPPTAAIAWSRRRSMDRVCVT